MPTCSAILMSALWTMVVSVCVQVVDLATEEPHRALRQFLELPRLRVLVCGGDGTAKWIMNVLEELQVRR